MKKHCFFIILCLLFRFYNTNAQNEIGTPFIRVYTENEYNASAQNFCITQDYRGLIYVANDWGILEYDGVSWRLITTPNNEAIRSLTTDSRGQVFVGGNNEIGYLKPDATGKMQYQSLLNKLPDSLQSNFTIWEARRAGNMVFFNTAETFLFGYANDSIHVWNTNSFLEHIFTFDDTLHIKCYDGVFKLNNNKLVFIQDFEKQDIFDGFFASAQIDSTSVLMGSNVGKLYKYQPSQQKITPLNIDASFENGNNIFSLSAFNDNYIAIGSKYKGCLIIDHTGKPYKLIDNTLSLPDNLVSYCYTDHQNNLWLALNNGIAHVDWGVPITYWDIKNGLLGTTADILRHNNQLYISTHQGVFYIQNNDIKAVENIKSQCLDLLSFSVQKQNLLLAANNKGVFTIQNGMATQAFYQKNVYKLYQLKHKSDILLVGQEKIEDTDIQGLSIYEYKQNQWEQIHTQLNIPSSVRYITQDKQNNIWLATEKSGVIKLNPNLSEQKSYGVKNGLPSDNGIILSNLWGDVAFGTPAGIYCYDAQQDSILPLTKLEAWTHDGTTDMLQLKQDLDSNIWIAGNGTNGKMFGFFRNKGSHYLWYDEVLKQIPSMTVNCIYPDTNQVVWIGGTKGVFRFDAKRYFKTTPYKTLIRQVVLNNEGSDSIIFNGTNYVLDSKNHVDFLMSQTNEMRPKIDYRHNTITFYFAATSFADETAIRYRYQLKGFDSDLSVPVRDSYKQYTNLPEGNYDFEVVAFDVYSAQSEKAHFRFIVLPPWYRTWWAYGIYVILFGGFVWAVAKINARRLEQANIRLEKVIQERTAEIVQKNTLLEEQKSQIAVQRDQIQEAFNDIKTLSEIGREVTSNLSIEKINETAHRNIASLMSSDAFGIGIYNALENTIEYTDFIRQGVKIPLVSHSLEDKTSLSVWCFNNQKEIFISNYSDEYHKYYEIRKPTKMQSLLYAPLFIQDNIIGIVTNQCMSPNAYYPHDINILKNLAIYIAIAIENANAYRQIERQKEEISSQRDSITNSIQYAKRIQQALLPALEISNNIDWFVFYRPRDIVSGDFYWIKQVENKLWFAAADCTGHGVPGAFMSMLGIAFLNEINDRTNEINAGNVLDLLRQKIKTSLGQSGSREQKDGMDIAFGILDLNSKVLQYAGAHNPLCIVRKQDQQYELIETKADKQPIGTHLRETPFSNHIINLQSNDLLYLFSDGYEDQVGGEKNKKFLSKNLKNLLVEIAQLPFDQQRQKLKDTFDQWRGQHEQVDDVLVMGVMIL